MRTTIFAVAVILAASPVAWAGGDKQADAFVDASSLGGGANGFTNGTSVGKLKAGGCKWSGQLKSLNMTAVPDGAHVICVSGAEVRSGLLPAETGNSVIFRGVAKGGQVKMKADLTTMDIGGLHCGTSMATSWGGETKCFLGSGAPGGDADYDDENDSINWVSKCTAAGMIVVKSTLWIPGADPAKVNVLGLCQGTAPNQRIADPVGAEVARQGQTNPVMAP